MPKQVKDAWKSVLAEVNEKYKQITTTEQVKTKWNTLKGIYRTALDLDTDKAKHVTGTSRVKLSGATLKYYTARHAILGNDQASAPACLVDGDDIKTSEPLPQANSPACATPATPVTPAGATAATAKHPPVASDKPSRKEKAKAPRVFQDAADIGPEAFSHAALAYGPPAVLSTDGVGGIDVAAYGFSVPPPPSGGTDDEDILRRLD
ncbi:hypothetical protein CYMTET_47906 [Cymbomonas tetramitiformis]|uniref:Myb/SANT-like domain-containing protein n=1 Tax=Cymbomonas tetramitiformis TaxID=36881 RepID=A0AAE0BUV2_9CHLO|nr:hypothetical protein CYMTET_47906 [Cymbomonas tetramitiformis]